MVEKIADKHFSLRRSIMALMHPELWMLSQAARCIAAALISCVLMVRAKELLTMPAFWAEDGTIFYGPAWNHSSVSLLFHPYSGYLHLFPRLCAALAALFPLQYGPAVMCWLGFALMCVPVFCVLYNKNLGFTCDAARILAALVYVDLPFPKETVATPANSQWFGLLLLAFAYISDKNPKINIWALCAFLLFGLSGPFCLFFCVFMLLDRPKLRPEKLVLIAVALIQLCFVVHTDRLASHHIGGLAIFRCFAETFKQAAFAEKSHWFIVLVLLGLTLWSYGFCGNRRLAWLVVALALMCCVSAEMGGEPLIERYTLPMLWISWLFLSNMISAMFGRAPYCLVPGAAVLTLWAAGFAFVTYPNRQITPWRDVVVMYDGQRKGDTLFVSIAPKGWYYVGLTKK